MGGPAPQDREEVAEVVDQQQTQLPTGAPQATAAPADAGTADEPAVRATGLRLAYGDRLALHAPQLCLPAGRSTAVIGPNGSGKSSLLDAICGLLRPWAGSIAVFGSPVTARPRGISYVLQGTHSDTVTPVTVREVVRMGRYPHRGLWRRLNRTDHATVQAALDRLALDSLASRLLTELSGGQRQRVFVAQALAQQAPLMLLDEPMTGLDLLSQQRISHALTAARHAGRTVVYTTHSVTTAAEADRVVLLAGTVTAAGPPASVLTTPVLQQAYGTHLDTDATMPDEPHPHASTHPHE